jgi:putative nucleotidyltransferase with HDIG domain
MLSRRSHHRRIEDIRRKFLEEEKVTAERSNLATINALAYAIEARDPYTRGHSERVASYAVWMANTLGLDRKRVQILRHCCRLHDVGKIGVADHILLKPGRLTMEERAKIELHPVYGAEILEGLKFIKAGIPIILHHHERHDGMGYPYGLKKDKIPVEVKIITIADAFDAMTSDRPYRKALPMDEVVREFRQNAGGQFDPRMARLFLGMLESADVSLQTPAATKKKAA